MNDIKEILINPIEIKNKIKEIGEQITKDYKNKNLVIIGILKGSFIFLSDLTRSIKIPHEIDFIRASSYGTKTCSEGDVCITKDIEICISGKDVLICEDIYDAGYTLNTIVELIKLKNPSSVKICSLLEKDVIHKKIININYLGFFIPNEFVVGYGLDYAEYYRNLPFIGVLNKTVYL